MRDRIKELVEKLIEIDDNLDTDLQVSELIDGDYVNQSIFDILNLIQKSHIDSNTDDEYINELVEITYSVMELCLFDLK